MMIASPSMVLASLPGQAVSKQLLGLRLTARSDSDQYCGGDRGDGRGDRGGKQSRLRSVGAGLSGYPGNRRRRGLGVVRQIVQDTQAGTRGQPVDECLCRRSTEAGQLGQSVGGALGSMPAE